MWLNCFGGTLKKINYNQLRCEKAGRWQKPGTTLLESNWSPGSGTGQGTAPPWGPELSPGIGQEGRSVGVIWEQ